MNTFINNVRLPEKSIPNGTTLDKGLLIRIIYNPLSTGLLLLFAEALLSNFRIKKKENEFFFIKFSPLFVKLPRI